MSRRLSVHKAVWPLRHPFRITGHVFEVIETVMVHIGERNHIGRGEGAAVYYMSETADGLMDQIEAIRSDIEQGLSREDLQMALPAGGARNALDCALWDLECQIRGKSIWDLTGLSPKPTQTVFTIGIEENIADMAQKAKDAALYPVLKVKLDGTTPVERMRAIRQARPEGRIIVDANQGFTFEQLCDVLPEFAELGIAMVEQPLPRGKDAQLEGFKSPIPLCADESCLHRADLPHVLPRYDMINIKLDKTGGLTEALALMKAAQAAEKKLMVGNMLGSSLAMIPAFVVAQVCSFVDLDGPLSLKSDYLDGIKYLNADIITPQPGFWGVYN